MPRDVMTCADGAYRLSGISTTAAGGRSKVRVGRAHQRAATDAAVVLVKKPRSCSFCRSRKSHRNGIPVCGLTSCSSTCEELLLNRMTSCQPSHR